jgi:ABC-type transport system involved in Fe-S cluster assembly fused permease/ATPase subunit
MSSGTPESAIVAAGVGAFFNIFRFAIDVVAKASQSDEDESDKKSDDTSSVGTNKSYLKKSVLGTITSSSIATGTPTKQSTIFSRLSGTSLDGSIDESVHKSAVERFLPMVSLTTQILLFVYFLTMTILTIQRPDEVKAIYNQTLLATNSVMTLFGIFNSIHDYHRNRFSTVQRTFYVFSTSITMLGCITFIAMSRTSDSPSTTIDYVTMSLQILYVLLALLEVKLFKYPLIVDEYDGSNPHKKKHLGKALIIILKPYFWPDATASSALLNRTRAIMTWVFVAASKACSLTSPIFLGKASTALSRMEWAECARFAIIYSAIQFTSTFFKECQSLVYLKVSQAAFVQLSEVSFHHLHSLSLDWHLKKKLGEVIRSMDRGILSCDTLMKYLFLWLVPAISEAILVCIVFAIYFDYKPLALTIFTFVFVYIFWTIIVTLWRKKFRKSVAKNDNDWHDKCTDSLINFETVKYFTAEKYEIERFSDSVKKFQSSSVNVQASLSLLNITQMVLMQCCLAIALVLSTYAIQDRTECCIANGCEIGNSQCCSDLAGTCGGMEVGDFVAVLTYTLNLFGPLNFLGSVYNAVVMALVDLRNLSELLAEDPDLVDAPDAMEMPKTNASDPDVAVEFDNVQFRYPSQGDNMGLKGVSFKMMRGTTTAIVGTTGAGKTTISRLLFRFYDVLGGAVKLNGVDVRALTQRSLRNAIGVVPQSTSMFNDTLRANVLYGKRDGTQDDLDQVADSAQLTDFVQTLPEGWDTVVGDRGLKLSGGEKQRTAIARCLLKNPPFVMLDEATSALDTVTENSVQEALDALGSERTCLVIAHRLGTIRNADNIIVLGDGVVLEQGTHDELLKNGGKYADMWNMQLHSTNDLSPTTLSSLE